jgi:hypothetical protein
MGPKLPSFLRKQHWQRERVPGKLANQQTWRPPVLSRPPLPYALRDLPINPKSPHSLLRTPHQTTGATKNTEYVVLTSNVGL